MDELDEAEMYRTLSQEDALGVVVRAAIYVEHQMDLLIDTLTASPEAVKRLNLDYNGKVDLCIVFGLDPRFRPPLAALGSVRNKFAHTLKSDITAEDTNAIYNALAGPDKQIVQSTYDKLRRRQPGGRPKRMLSLQPLELFTLLAVSLRAALLAGRRQVEKEGSV